MPFAQHDMPAEPVKPEPKANPVYARLLAYVALPAIAAAGFGTYDAEAGTLLLTQEDVFMAATLGGSIALNVFQKWGKK